MLFRRWAAAYRLRTSYRLTSRAGFAFTTDAMLSIGMWAVFILAIGLSIGGVARVAGDYFTKTAHENEITSTLATMRSYARSAHGRFTPPLDINAQPNCVNGQCHEVVFYTKDAAGHAHYIAYDYSGGKLQAYRYNKISLVGGNQVPCQAAYPCGATAADMLQSGGSSIQLTNFWVKEVTASTLATDANSSPLFKALLSKAGGTVTDSVIQFVGPNTHASNAVIIGQMVAPGYGTDFSLVSDDLATANLTEDVGYYTPSPPPAIQGTVGTPVVFYWPSAPNQSFGVHEDNYHDQFYATDGSCSASVASVSPVNPTGMYPSPNTPGQNSGNADFTATANGSPGFCDLFVYDAYHNRSGPPTYSVDTEVMGPLTAQWTSSGGTTYQGTSSSALSLPVNDPQTATPLFKDAGDSINVLTYKTFDGQVLNATVTFDATCSQYLQWSSAGSSMNGNGATATSMNTVRFTLVNPLPSGNPAVQCGGTFGDQYGEPTVPFALRIDPGGVTGSGTVSVQTLFQGAFQHICQQESKTQCGGIYTDNIAEIDGPDSTWAVGLTWWGGYKITVSGQTSWIALHFPGVSVTQNYGGPQGYVQYNTSYTYYPPTVAKYTTDSVGNPNVGYFGLAFLQSANYITQLSTAATTDNWGCYEQDYNLNTAGPLGYITYYAGSSPGGIYCNSNPANLASPATSGTRSSFLALWWAMTGGDPNANPVIPSVTPDWLQTPTGFSGGTTIDSAGNFVYTQYYQLAPGTYYILLDYGPTDTRIYGGTWHDAGTGSWPVMYDYESGVTSLGAVTATVLSTPPTPLPTPSPDPCAAKFAYLSNPDCPQPDPTSKPSGGVTGGGGGNNPPPAL